METNEYSYRQKQANKSVNGNHKAATITGSLSAQKQSVRVGSWSNLLQTYCDYLIRY